MAEMTWTTLVIGGPLPQNKVAQFRELAEEYFGGSGAVDDPNVLIDCRFRRIPARYSELMPAGIPI